MTTRPQAEHPGLLPGAARMRLAVALFAAFTLALISACGSSSTSQQRESLPDGNRLLADSAAAMRSVNTIHFTLTAQGDTPGISLRYADGQLTQQGSAKGVARMQQGERVVQQEFVITGDTLYLRDPASGNYQKLPASMTGATYNPSVILNPNQGIAAVLASGKDATTKAHEKIAGVDTYRVEATFPRESLSKLLPGISGDTPGTLWIATQDARLVDAQFRVGGGLVTVHFSDYNAPVTINTPL